MSVILKAMTFNMRCISSTDNENSFEKRKPRILAMLEEEKPDIIGCQEVTPPMREWLAGALTEYTVVGCGRKSDYSGEGMTVAFRRDRLELIGLDQYWLSTTPRVPGSFYGGDQSGCPRMAAALKLYLAGTQKPFLFLNTHLDHKGHNARFLGMLQNIQYIDSQPLSYIYVGDMNAHPDSEPILLAKEYFESHGAKEVSEEITGTFHNYGRKDPPSKIDYIYTDFNCNSCRLVTKLNENGLYYSDHFALIAEIEIP